MDTKPVQTRSEKNGLRYFETIKEAMSYAVEDPSIWKMSFNAGDERVRLVRNHNTPCGWLYESITEPLSESKSEESEVALAIPSDSSDEVIDVVAHNHEDKVIEAVETIANAGANWLVDKLKRELARR